MSFILTRVFRHYVDGAPQIEPFPDTSPPGDTDIEVRIAHFTEIENFTLLGYDLAHELEELDRKLRPISTIQNLEVGDVRIQMQIEAARNLLVNAERLADFILDVGLRWEHFVASFNDKMIPGEPLKVIDPAVQTKIDSLDEFTEALVEEVNLRVRKAIKEG